MALENYKILPYYGDRAALACANESNRLDTDL
jgi:hypothetical protein